MSIWQKDVKNINKKELIHNGKYDVAVIGAGMAGLLCAYALQKQNFKVIVLEANTIGSGQSGKTTAKITAQHGLIYHKLLNQFGKDKAKQYLDANLKAIEQFAELIDQEAIDCDFKRCASYLFSLHQSDDLKKEQQALDVLGMKTVLENKCEIPLAITQALKMENQAQFNPMKFMQTLAKSLCIYEHTKVLNVNDHELTLQNGTLYAKHIVFATHFPFINIPGFYFLKMHQERSYVLAIKNAQKLQDMYYCIDSEVLSMRNYQDVLLLGGESHRCGENSNGGRYENLKLKAKALYPEGEVITMWSAQDCMTLDGIPYIGNYSSSKEDWYVITGFNKWGMTTSMVAAQIISAQIQKKKHDYEDVFSAQRFDPLPSATSFWEQTQQSIKSIYREVFSIPTETLKNLPCKHGGVITVDGEKVGVYKDEKGKSYIVNVRCPHLGCQLEWNPDELSWDCPCHGSRFDYNGNLIDNPAQEHLYE